MNASDALRVVLTGASGYLGRHLLEVLPTNWHTWACYHRRALDTQPHIIPVALDVSDGEAVDQLVRAVQPHVVLHTAIARNEADFEAVIVRGSAHVAGAAARAGARLIHLSTDIVFAGTALQYDENASPHPEPAPGQTDALSAHGRAKARAEHAVRTQHPDPVIVRTSLIYGFEPLDHSTTWLVDGVRSGKPVTLFTDQLRCPIYAPDLAACLWELMQHSFTGAINLAGPLALSRYDFGLLLCQALGLDPGQIRAIPTPSDFPAPQRLILSDELARRLLRSPRRSPHEVCRAYRRNAHP